MRFPEYKYIYADTNVVSDICKSKSLMNIFMKKFSLTEHLFCFSTYTLYEINKSDEIMTQFEKFYSAFPCVIIVSYFPLGLKEFEFIEDSTKLIDPLLLTPQGIKVEGKSLSPDSLKVLMSKNEVQEAFINIENYTNQFFEEMKSLFDSEEFIGVSRETCNRDQFIARFKKYELRHRFLGGKKLYANFSKEKINKMKSLDVLAQGIYYKFYSDSKRKVNKSDIIDVLIMTSAPYFDTFISEGNCIDIYNKILRKNRCGINGNSMTLSELRNSTFS